MKLWRLSREGHQKGSFVITIPKDILMALGWDEGDQLVLNRQDGKLIVENLTKRVH
jgi:AbrB family looped-hinge helix DNA binding protein